MAFLTRLSVLSRSTIQVHKRAMSSAFHDALARLKSPVKELVTAVTDNGQRYIGETETDRKQVVTWIEKSNEIVGDADVLNLETSLLPKTYVATNYFTAADVALYGSLHPIIVGKMSHFQPSQYYAVPSVTRYFDHIQNQKSVQQAVTNFAALHLVQFDLNNAPAVEKKVEPQKKNQKKAATGPPSTPTPAKDAATPALSTQEKLEKEKPQKEKKEKKEKKKDAAAAEQGGKASKGAKAAPAAAEDAGVPVPSMIDLRVGHIVDVMKHPDADGLYIEQIDLGEETGPRTVVSGLVNYIPIEDMRDKYLVAVCNLKPANMRGVKSFAMVLAATSKDGKDAGIELVQPPLGSKPGERVYFEGAEFENATPLSQLNPKKKIFETIQPGFITLESREAAWVNPETKSVHRIRTKDGVCVAPTLVGASLS